MVMLVLIMTIMLFSVSMQTPNIRRDNQCNNLNVTPSVITSIPSFTRARSTYELGESSRSTKRYKRPALRSHTPVRFNLNVDGGEGTKEYDKFVGVSEGISFISHTNAIC